jgi:hypothetical protein
MFIIRIILIAASKRELPPDTMLNVHMFIYGLEHFEWSDFGGAASIIIVIPISDQKIEILPLLVC